MMLKPRILVVDEHPQDCRQYRAILEADGNLSIATLTSTDTAAQALELAAEAIDNGQSYTLAILDQRFSNGMDGVSAARELRRLDDTIVIAFISSHNDYNAADIDHQLGHDVVLLNKPVTSDELRLLTLNAGEQWQQNQNQRILSAQIAKVAERNNNGDQQAHKIFAELSQALSTVEQNMVIIRQEDEKIQLLHHQLQHTLADQYPSSEAVEEVQQALDAALQKYRQYCASPELLTAVMQLRKLQKNLPL
ncbi:MAG TPA: hypothetical protein DE045_00840 [Oceanospirillaceae bacterium]|nr:hypothetical protein [Oceanospirillaceae bacterium]